MTTKLERQIYRLCTKHQWTLAVAESCTGGLISHRLTNVPGSSQYFQLAVVAYSYPSKERLLRVPHRLLQRHGAVSRSVVLAMARGVRRAARVTVGLAVTGIAGPGGGLPHKPVGTVWIGVSTATHARAFHHRFIGSRQTIKRLAAQAALRHLYALLRRG